MSGDGRKTAESGDRVPGNIILVGMMGAGKTSVGKLLARRLGKAFYDCDHEIERATGVKVAVIFEIEGEGGFRVREAKTLAELVRYTNTVLATGGGAVLSADNRRLLRESGVVVYLRANPADLNGRTRHDRNRPLLHTADPLARLKHLFDERDPLYRETAHIIVDTGEQSLGNLARKLELQLLRHQTEARGCAGAPLGTG